MAEQNLHRRPLGLSETNVERRRKLGGAPLVHRGGQDCLAGEIDPRRLVVEGADEPRREALEKLGRDPPVVAHDIMVGALCRHGGVEDRGGVTQPPDQQQPMTVIQAAVVVDVPFNDVLQVEVVTAEKSKQPAQVVPRDAHGLIGPLVEPRGVEPLAS